MGMMEKIKDRRSFIWWLGSINDVTFNVLRGGCCANMVLYRHYD